MRLGVVSQRLSFAIVKRWHSNNFTTPEIELGELFHFPFKNKPLILIYEQSIIFPGVLYNKGPADLWPSKLYT